MRHSDIVFNVAANEFPTTLYATREVSHIRTDGDDGVGVFVGSVEDVVAAVPLTQYALENIGSFFEREMLEPLRLMTLDELRALVGGFSNVGPKFLCEARGDGVAIYGLQTIAGKSYGAQATVTKPESAVRLVLQMQRGFDKIAQEATAG